MATPCLTEQCKCLATHTYSLEVNLKNGYNTITLPCFLFCVIFNTAVLNGYHHCPFEWYSALSFWVICCTIIWDTLNIVILRDIQHSHLRGYPVWPFWGTFNIAILRDILYDPFERHSTFPFWWIFSMTFWGTFNIAILTDIPYDLFEGYSAMPF